ncbi:MAG: hypothetical protein ACHBN1_07685 [Heteroscytonema crispum UTEX LB 1556]
MSDEEMLNFLTQPLAKPEIQTAPIPETPPQPPPEELAQQAEIPVASIAETQPQPPVEELAQQAEILISPTPEIEQEELNFLSQQPVEDSSQECISFDIFNFEPWSPPPATLVQESPEENIPSDISDEETLNPPPPIQVEESKEESTACDPFNEEPLNFVSQPPANTKILLHTTPRIVVILPKILPVRDSTMPSVAVTETASEFLKEQNVKVSSAKKLAHSRSQRKLSKAASQKVMKKLKRLVSSFFRKLFSVA